MMAKTTITFGTLLILIAVVGYFLLGAKPHAAGVGVLLVICGVLANTENSRKRMLWMHIAVTVGLLGAVIPSVMLVAGLFGAHTQLATAAPGLIYERVLVILVCVVYVALCVRSFIAARKARLV
jgi:hypothetical protein